MSINYLYTAKFINGGAIGALDRIDGEQLKDGDSAIVMTEAGYVYFYTLNQTSGATEAAPRIIEPDTNPESKRWILADTIFGDVTTVENLVVKGNLTIEGFSNIAETLDFLVLRDLLVQDDATVKNNLSVEGRIIGAIDTATIALEAQDFKVHKDLVVQDDATVKNHLFVEGRILGTVDNATQALEAQDFNVHMDLVVQDDATIKDDLVVEGLIFGTLADSPAPGAHDHNYTDPVFDDATIKDTLRVERLAEVRNLDVLRRLHVHDDATVKNNLRVEGFIGGASPVRIQGGVNVVGTGNVTALDISDDITIRDDATIKGDLRIDKNVFITGSIEAGAGISGGASLDPYYEDATIKNNLTVQERAEINYLHVMRDATIHGHLYIKGTTEIQGINVLTVEYIYVGTRMQHTGEAGTGISLGNGTLRLDAGTVQTRFDAGSIRLSNSGFRRHLIQPGNVTIQDGRLLSKQDATVKGDLIVEGNLTLDAQALFIQGDATVKDDLVVEGFIFGTLADPPSLTEAQDFKVHKDLVVQDDATIKDDLRIENLLFVGQNINALRSVEVERSFISHDATVLNQMLINDLYIHEQKTTSKMIIQSSHDMSIKCETGHYLNFALAAVTYLHLENGNSYINEPFEFKDTLEIDKILTLNSQLYLEKGIEGEIILRRDTTAKGNLYIEDHRPGGLGMAKGLTTDFTSGTIRFEVVKGIIVNQRTHI